MTRRRADEGKAEPVHAADGQQAAAPRRRPRCTPTGRVARHPGRGGAVRPARRGDRPPVGGLRRAPRPARRQRGPGAAGGRAGPPRPRDDARLPLLAQRRRRAHRGRRCARRWPSGTPDWPTWTAADRARVARRWTPTRCWTGGPTRTPPTARDTTRADLRQARTVGAHRLAEVAPERVAAWKALQTAQPTPVTGRGRPPGTVPGRRRGPHRRTAERVPTRTGWGARRMGRGGPARGEGGRHGGADDRRVDQPHRDRGPGRREGRPARPVPDQPRHAPVSTNPGVAATPTTF